MYKLRDGFFRKFSLGVWNIGIADGWSKESFISESNPIRIRWMKHPYRDRFFADPFLHRCDNNYYYILAEEFPFWTNIGYISLLKVERHSMRLVEKKKVIESEYHLSYPFPYKDLIIPECFRSEKCFGYSLNNDAVTQVTEIAPFGLIDSTFLEYNGYEWIFATDKDNPLCGLKIFYRKLGDKDWMPHKRNPVSEDISTARPGGHFFRIGNVLYRPAQDSQKLYGHQIQIMRVDTLTPEEYKETRVKTINSNNNPPYDMGFHTFNVEDGFVVVDGFREYHSFIIKPLTVLYSKMKRLAK